MAGAVTRRKWLQVAGAGIAGRPLPARPSRPMRLGGPVFEKTGDPALLARAHRKLGYRAAYCPPVQHDDAARIAAIAKAFASEDVAIAEVGAWVNMLDPDPEIRRRNIRTVIERLSLADRLGARCCVDIAGSYNPKVWYGPDKKNLSREFFDATVENVRRVIDEVRPTRTSFTIEMMPWSLPDGPDAYLQLIRAVDRKAFAVHLDVCNIINSPARFYHNGEVIRECFRKLGPWIMSCHAKDLAWLPEFNIHFKEVVPGRGEIDYRAYLTELSKLPVDAPLMLEHLGSPAEYEEGRDYIFRIAGELGLSFG
jgi:sugar phosphate isomerase/epimerase